MPQVHTYYWHVTGGPLAAPFPWFTLVVIQNLCIPQMMSTHF
jgi:hypothetical protein